jgi:hypothetical protein
LIKKIKYGSKRVYFQVETSTGDQIEVRCSQLNKTIKGRRLLQRFYRQERKQQPESEEEEEEEEEELDGEFE